MTRRLLTLTVCAAVCSVLVVAPWRGSAAAVDPNPPAYGARIATLEQDVRNLWALVLQQDRYGKYLRSCAAHHVLHQCLVSMRERSQR